jgi:hypothetical protein
MPLRRLNLEIGVIGEKSVGHRSSFRKNAGYFFKVILALFRM